MVEDECGLGVVDPELWRRGDKVRILHHQPKDFTTEARFSEKDFEVRLGNSALFHLFTVILCFSLTSRRTSCLWWTTSEAGTGSVAALRLARSFGPRGEEPRPITSTLQTTSTEKLNLSLGTTAIIDCLTALKLSHSNPFYRILKDLRTETPRKSGEGRTDSAVSPGKKNKRRFLESWVTPKDKDKSEKEKGDNKHSDKNSAPAPSVIKEEKEAPLSAVKIEKEEKEETEKEVEEEKDPLEVIRERTGIVVKTGAGFESRWSTTVLEEENFQPDCASLNLVAENQDNLGKRAVAVSTIFRNLSFVPGNETILSSSAGFLAVCGKMLLHHHWHPPRTSKQRNYDRGEEEDFTESCTSLSDQPEWWWDHLQVEFRIPWCFTKSPFLGTDYMERYKLHFCCPVLSQTIS